MIEIQLFSKCCKFLQLNKKRQMTTFAKSFNKILRFVNIGQNKKRLNSTMSTCGIIYWGKSAGNIK